MPKKRQNSIKILQGKTMLQAVSVSQVLQRQLPLREKFLNLIYVLLKFKVYDDGVLLQSQTYWTLFIVRRQKLALSIGPTE
jgi:hypothetical protein